MTQANYPNDTVYHAFARWCTGDDTEVNRLLLEAFIAGSEWFKLREAMKSYKCFCSTCVSHEEFMKEELSK